MEVSPECPRRGGGPVLVRRRSPVPLGLRETLKARLWRSCTCSTRGAWAWVQDLLPATRWLRQYRPREALAGDVMSGLVIGIILVPQAIAYSLLAGLQPIYSLYTSFFANLIYFVMGTSRHVSVGIFSLLCLMVGQVVDRELLLAGFGPAQDGPGPAANGSAANASATATGLGPPDCGQDCYAIRVATALTLVAGIYQVRGRPRERAKPRAAWGRGSENAGFNPQGQDRAGRGPGGLGRLPRVGPQACSPDTSGWPECGPHGSPVSRPGRDPERLPLFPQRPHTQGSPVHPRVTLRGAPGLLGGGSATRRAGGRSCFPMSGARTCERTRPGTSRVRCACVSTRVCRGLWTQFTQERTTATKGR